MSNECDFIVFHFFCRYAGWLGTIAARCTENDKLLDTAPTLLESRHRLAVVAGTSTCHLVQVSDMDLPSIFLRSYLDLMMQSPDGVFVNGVWGPYKVKD